MPATKIVLASLLKPVDETRMYEKLGLSLVETNKYEINIIGFSTKNAANPEPIIWHPLFDFNRNSWKRLFAPIRVLRRILKVKPKVIIVNTPELLGVILLYKILFGGVIIYDVIENYVANIRHTDTYPKWLRPWLVITVRFTEWFSKYWVNHYFVAEKTYLKELSFLKKDYTLLENKYKSIDQNSESHENTGKDKSSPTDRFRFIYSGSISKHYGIFEAIHLIDALHQLDDRIFLTIIGFASNGELMPEIQDKIKDKPYFELIGGDVLVPHQQLIDAIASSHIGLVPYQYNESTFNCIPTKMYEYMAHYLPVIIPENPLWENLCKQYNAGFAINYTDFNASNVLEKCRAVHFYNSQRPMNIYWESEENRLLAVIDHLLKKD